MASKPMFEYSRSETTPASTSFLDLTLRVIAVVMGIAVITLLTLDLITVKNAIVLLSVGLLAVSLERLSDKG
jgi:hypothetical protein